MGSVWILCSSCTTPSKGWKVISHQHHYLPSTSYVYCYLCLANRLHCLRQVVMAFKCAWTLVPGDDCLGGSPHVKLSQFKHPESWGEYWTDDACSYHSFWCDSYFWLLMLLIFISQSIWFPTLQDFGLVSQHVSWHTSVTVLMASRKDWMTSSKD